jgi:cardiolipin synthase
MAVFGGVLMGLAAVAILWPRVVAIPLAVLMTWLGVAMLINAVRLRHRRSRRKRSRTPARVKTNPPTPP